MAGPARKAAKACFVICPIGADKSGSRVRSDRVLKYIIRPILEDAGYKVERADQLDEPGIITNQIVKKIVECDILIADLSEANPNVFYELALRHGLKKPFIHLIDASEKIPFDNSQVRTIQFDIKDLDSVDSAKNQLKAQINSIERGESIAESPISVAFDLEALKAGGAEDTGILSVLLDEVMMLGREVRGMRNNGATGRRYLKFDDKADLLQFLYDEGHKPLLDLVEKHVSYLNCYDTNLSISTDLNSDKEQALMADISHFLTSKTGRKWTVDDMPF